MAVAVAVAVVALAVAVAVVVALAVAVAVAVAVALAVAVAVAVLPTSIYPNPYSTIAQLVHCYRLCTFSIKDHPLMLPVYSWNFLKKVIYNYRQYQK